MRDIAWFDEREENPVTEVGAKHAAP
jgi:hypothetical protein